VILRCCGIIGCIEGCIYIETSVISYLKGRISTDTIVAAHQKLTNKWWDERASRFDVVVSELVYREAAAGDAEAGYVCPVICTPEELMED